MQPALFFFSINSEIQPIFVAGTDPVGGVHDSVPLHPKNKHPGADEFKQKKRTPHPNQPSEHTDGTPPDPDHQIDDYA